MYITISKKIQSSQSACLFLFFSSFFFSVCLFASIYLSFSVSVYLFVCGGGERQWWCVCVYLRLVMQHLSKKCTRKCNEAPHGPGVFSNYRRQYSCASVKTIVRLPAYCLKHPLLLKLFFPLYKQRFTDFNSQAYATNDFFAQ